MMGIRRANERGATALNWLDSRHTFSFGHYYDPDFMGFRFLRVINDDRVAPGMGFGTHPHREMEIISYVVEGALEHRDSIGTGSVIRAGEVQRMSAGTGISHSEFNASATEPVRFLQIWIPPSMPGLEPSYQQMPTSLSARPNELCVLVSPDGREDSLTIHRDVVIYGARLEADRSIVTRIGEQRSVWIQVIRGALLVDEELLQEGDGLAVVDEKALTLTGQGEGSEFLFFDLD